MVDRTPWWSTRFTLLPKIIIGRLSKMLLAAYNPVPRIFLESLEMNSIAHITA